MTSQLKRGDVVIFRPWYSPDFQRFQIIKVNDMTVDLGTVGDELQRTDVRRAKKRLLFRYDAELWEAIEKASVAVHEKQKELWALHSKLVRLET